MRLGRMTLLRPRPLTLSKNGILPKSITKLFTEFVHLAFETAFSFKTHEEIVGLPNGWWTISLIKLEAIHTHLKDKLHFMRIVLVQVAVKPSIRKGINASIYMALRDKRMKKYKSSLWALINTNIRNRPTFFNCCPDFCVDLLCHMTPEALKLDVHIQGGEFHDFKSFAIMYRVYFWLMSTNLSTKVSSTLPWNSKETILLQIEDDKPPVFTPKIIKWKEITIPEAIELEDVQSASDDKSKQMNDIEQIIEETDGVVLFRFCSFREPISLAGTSVSRKSFSGCNSDRGIVTKKPLTYGFRSPIADAAINDPPSPSLYGIGYGYNVLTNPDFAIDWPFLRGDYDSTSNAPMVQTSW